jgi:1-pyrroline-5-carboxylate dehydrogenase
MAEKFKLTYATMFNPPEELHMRFDEALNKLKANLGKEYGLIINNKDVFAAEKFEDRSPANADVVLGSLAGTRGFAAQGCQLDRGAQF